MNHPVYIFIYLYLKTDERTRTRYIHSQGLDKFPFTELKELTRTQTHALNNNKNNILYYYKRYYQYHINKNIKKYLRYTCIFYQ